MNRRRSTHTPVPKVRKAPRSRHPREPFSHNRIALRIAARSASASVGRSLLIALLIALPISGLSTFVVVWQSLQATTAETLETTLGESQARVRMVSGPDAEIRQVANNPDRWRTDTSSGSANSSEPRRNPRDILPVGADIASVYSTSVVLQTATGIATIRALEGRPWDPSLRGHFTLVAGTVPTRDHEIMASESALARLGARLGSTVEMTAPFERPFTVVGVLDNRSVASSEAMIFGREGALSAGVDAQIRIAATDYYLPTTVLDWPAVQKLNAQGATVLSRTVLLNPPPPQRGDPVDQGFLPVLLPVLALAGFTVFEVVLLAGAAFAVNARQLNRTLAIIASVGGTRSTLFRIVSASGVVLGFIGGVVGVALGIAGGAVVMALTSDGSATRYFGFHLNVPLLIGAVVFAALVGWIAALLPARAASRLDIVGALRGARRPPKPSRRRPIIGVVVMAGGAALTLLGGVLLVILAQQQRTISQSPGNAVWFSVAFVVIGPIVMQLGLALCGPLVLGAVAALSRHGSISRRLATQDAACNPARSVPALSAILTCVFVAVFAMCMVGSGQVTADRAYDFTTEKGQIASSLWYSDSVDYSIVRAADSAPFEAAIADNIPVTTMRVLSAMPDNYRWPANNVDPALSNPQDGYPVLTVPAENLCFHDSRSTDNVPFGEWTVQMTRDDPRCNPPQWVSTSSDYSAHLWVGDAADLTLVLGHTPSAAALTALEEGHAVSLYSEYIHDGAIELEWWSAAQLEQQPGTDNDSPPLSQMTVPAVLEVPNNPTRFAVFVPTATADALGVPYFPALVLAQPTDTPTDAQMDAAVQANSVLTGSSDGNFLSIEKGPESFAALVAWILLAVSALIAIGASAVAIGLARFDGRRDDATLDSLGAGPRTRRNFAFWQSLLLVGLGATLGSALGILPALALQLPGSGQAFAPPWLQIGLVAIALPVLIATVSWCVAGRRPRLAHRASVA